MKQKEIASLFSASVSTIKKWHAEGFPVKGELKEMIAWVRFNRPLVTNAITDARTRKINAEARLKELELMIKQGELLPRQQIVDHNCGIILATKSAFLQLNRTLPPKLAGITEPRIQGDVIKKEVMIVLTNFHKGISRGVKK